MKFQNDIRIIAYPLTHSDALVTYNYACDGTRKRSEKRKFAGFSALDPPQDRAGLVVVALLLLIRASQPLYFGTFNRAEPSDLAAIFTH